MNGQIKTVYNALHVRFQPGMVPQHTQPFDLKCHWKNALYKRDLTISNIMNYKIIVKDNNREPLNFRE